MGSHRQARLGAPVDVEAAQQRGPVARHATPPCAFTGRSLLLVRRHRWAPTAFLKHFWRATGKAPP